MTLDSRQYSAASARRLGPHVRNWVGSVLETSVERSCKGAVQEDAWAAAGDGVPAAVFVASLLSDELEHVGTDVPSTESVESPVGLDSGDVRVVVVEMVISGAVEILWNGTTEQNAEDAVADVVGIWLALVPCACSSRQMQLTVLIEGQKDQCSLHEVPVRQERLEKVARPGAGDGDGGVMSV